MPRLRLIPALHNPMHPPEPFHPNDPAGITMQGKHPPRPGAARNCSLWLSTWAGWPRKCQGNAGLGGVGAGMDVGTAVLGGTRPFPHLPTRIPGIPRGLGDFMDGKSSRVSRPRFLWGLITGCRVTAESSRAIRNANVGSSFSPCLHSTSPRS